MKNNQTGILRLLALNLALILCLGVFVPVPSQAAGREAYGIWVGDTYFMSDEPKEGPGWGYDPRENALYLFGSYPGQAIRASGDLQLYTSGAVRVQGEDRNYYGESAIDVDGILKMLVMDESLTLVGGDAVLTGQPGRKKQAGCAIDAGGGVVCLLQGGSLYARGGDAPEGIAGTGVYARSMGIYMMSSTNSYRNLDDSVCYVGRRFDTDKIQLQGGRGWRGGNGAAGYSIRLDADGTVSGGESTFYDPSQWAGWSGHALYCHDYQIGSFWKEDSGPRGSTVTLTLTSGYIGTRAAEAERGMAQEYIRDHVRCRRSPDYGATPYKLEYYPDMYTTSYDGNGGSLNSGKKDYEYTTYPARAHLTDERFSRYGYYLYGYRNNGRLIMTTDLYIPYKDTRLTALWAPYDLNTILFLGNHGQTESGDYAVRRTREEVTVPTAESSYSQSDLLGWCTSASPEWDRSTGRVGAGERWLEPGTTTSSVMPRVYWANWQNPEYCTMRYHGNGGTMENGSNLAIKCTYATESSLKLYVGEEDLGLSREGYQFAGWYAAPEGGEQYAADHWIEKEQRLEVYAHWREIVSHRLALNGPLTMTYKDRPISLGQLVGQLTLDGTPVPGDAEITYQLDGHAATESTGLDKPGTYQLTVSYQDEKHVGELNAELTLLPNTTTVTFGETVPGYTTIAAFYDTNGRMICAMDTNGSGTVEIHNDIYSRVSYGRLFQLDGNSSPRETVLSFEKK